jgi:DHA2 family multidrug resistance protein-like MFS transporter
MSAAAHIPARAGRKEWLGLVVLALPCFLLAMDFNALHLAVPALTAQLAPSGTQLLWIVDIYGFLIAGSLITMGTLGDRIGRRKLLLIGASTFGLASVAAAFSTSATMLIVTRALLGVAGATLMPSTLALIRNMFHDENQRRIAIAVWINSFVIGSAIGPVLGGLMLEYFWWGSVFLLNVPVMILLLAFGSTLLPEFRDENAGRLDIASAALSLTGTLAIIYGIKRFAEDGAGLEPLAAVLIGLSLAMAFVRRQRTLDDPLIDLRLFSVPPFSAAVVTQLVAALSMGGIYLFIAQYLQLVLGLSPLQAGVALLPSNVGGIIGTILAPFLARRMKVAYVIASGMLLAAVGIAVLTRMAEGAPLATLVGSFVIMSMGFAGTMTLTTDVIMSVAPPERAGAASGISETSAELGMALGVAVLGSVGTALYRSSMEASMPAGLLPGAAESARSTLAGAIQATREIGGSSGDLIAEAARQSFAESLAAVSWISATLVIATTIITLILLRRIPPAADQVDSKVSAAA